MSDLLTPEEHEVMDLTGDLANALHAVIFADGHDDNAARDWNEVAPSIHAIQHTVLAQAAARAYPDRYRLLGRTLTRAEEEAAGEWWLVDVNFTPTEGSIEQWFEGHRAPFGICTTVRLDRPAVTLIFENEEGQRRSVSLDQYAQTREVPA